MLPWVEPCPEASYLAEFNLGWSSRYCQRQYFSRRTYCWGLPAAAGGWQCLSPTSPVIFLCTWKRYNSHHSYPGGLAVHESFNDLSDLSFATNYRRMYGQSGQDGLPVIKPYKNTSQDSADIYISNDIIIGAPIWHDWAKPIVFQWNSDGSEFQELNFAGNGKLSQKEII